MSASRTASILASILVAALAVAARADIYASTFRSPTWMVEMVAPRDWELSEQTSYPGVLAWAVSHKLDARLSLSAQRMYKGEDLLAYTERNARSLAKIGYRMFGPTAQSSGALLLEGTTPDDKRKVRQAYLVHEDIAYVLTLSSPAPGAGSLGRIFDDTLRSISFSAPPPASQSTSASQPASVPTTQPARRPEK